MRLLAPSHQNAATCLRLLSLVLVVCLGTVATPAQSQDAAKALGGLFGNLLRPNQAAPANNATNVLGNLLGATNNAPQKPNANAMDLVGLLSQSVEQIDEPKEIEIGRQLASVLLGAKPLHPNMALQRYVNRLGRWISLQSSRPDLPWTFGVLDDDGYNAFATPGGYIFITKGLVDHVADEAELAGILAHEITHVIGKHHLQAMRKSARSGFLTQLAVSQLKSDLAGGVSAQLLGLGRELYSRGLDQEDELEADRNGVALATRAGFDPYGLVAVLQQLRSESPDNPMFSLSFSTHPSAQVRLDQMELAMGQRLDQYTGNQQPVTVAQRLAGTGKR
jgi:predicted Zn-dependent protease